MSDLMDISEKRNHLWMDTCLVEALRGLMDSALLKWNFRLFYYRER